jgi:preprotein translocase subunit SecY
MRFPLGARVALTLAAPLFVAALAAVPLPRVDRQALEDVFLAYGASPRLSAFALGVMPVVSASLLVEIAALCVPRWRALRTGGPAGRHRLWSATAWLALLLGVVQSLSIASYLQSARSLEEDVRLSRLVVVLTLVGGTCVLVAAAELLDRFALGGGFALVVTASLVSSVAPLVARVGELSVNAGPAGTLPLLPPLVAAVAGVVFFLRWRPARGGVVSTLPLPASGLIPAQWAATAVGFGWISGVAGRLVLGVVVAAALAVVFGFVFNRPSKVAAFEAEAPLQVRQAVTWSAVFVIAVVVLDALLVPSWGDPWVGLVSLVPLIALALDVVAEAQAIRRHGELAAVWPEHRLYAVASAQRTLTSRGIASHARSLHQRALWHFFAPFIPVQILVPRAQAEEARRVLHENHLERR